ncbi:MAG: hypothetical protein KJ650_10035, partial [Firmicutes bacterium]|nr:hypothetical protein [Bacillota bacterium]
MTHSIQPLRAERFLLCALEYMEPFRGTYIYNAIVRDYREKTDKEDEGYGQCLKKLLKFLKINYNLKGSRFLVLGWG